MKTVNQFSARHTYQDFMALFGAMPNNQSEILKNGFGYAKEVKKFREDLIFRGISEEHALQELYPVLMSDYKDIKSAVLKLLKPKVKSK